MYSGPALGIWSSPNPFSAVPAGTLKRGDNVRFVAPSIIGPRPGMDLMAGTSFGSATSLADALAFYGASILLAHDLTNIALYSGSSFTDFDGDFLPVGDNRMRFEGAARSIFFNTAQGLKVWDGVGNAGQPVNAGNPQGLNITTLPVTENGWQSPNSAVAYRYTICSKDAFGRIIEGPPSGRTTARNSIVVPVGQMVNGSGTVQVLTLGAHYLETGDEVVLSPGEVYFPAGTYTVTVTGADGLEISSAGPDGSNALEEMLGVARANALTIQLPVDASTLNFVRVYRSFETALATDTPSDELFQVYESAYLVDDDLTAGQIAFIDTAPESQLEVPLYTNQNGAHGALSAHFRPPRALDIVYWANRMWFANTENKQSIVFSLLGVGSGGGIEPSGELLVYQGNTLSSAYTGVNFDPQLQAPVTAAFSTADTGGSLHPGTYYYRIVATAESGAVLSLPSIEASQVVPAGTNTNKVTLNWSAVTGATGYDIYGRISGGELFIASVGAVLTYVDLGSITPSGAIPPQSMGCFFQVYEDGAPGWNIQRTASSLVRSINTSPNFAVEVELTAYYISSEGGLPGTILLTARSFGDSEAFQLYSNAPNAWAPAMPNQPAPLWPAPSSDSNRHPAGLYYSELGLPEAVPLLNYDIINSDADGILRVFPLHYRLIIFKTDGFYTCTNVAPFSIQKLSAYRLIAPDSIAVLEDKLYCLTDQGVVTISDAGVVEISTPIQDLLLALGGPTSLDDLSTRAVGVAYPSARQYLLWLIEENDNETFTDDNAQAFVFSTLSAGFTRYDFGARCATLRPSTNQLVVAPIDDNQLWLENKTLTSADFADLTLDVVITAVDDGEVTLLDASDVEAGDAIYQTTSGQTSTFVVESVSGNVLTMRGEPPWRVDAASLVKAFACAVEFNKFTAAAPADMKMTDQVSLLFRKNGVHGVIANFSSEIEVANQSVEISQTGWGESAWGSQPWGSPTEQILRVEPLPPEVANCCQLSVGFQTRQARANFEFLGIDVAEHGDTRVNRG